MTCKKFGSNLKQLLGELGMSQAELASKAGLTPAAVCMFIKGTREPTLSSILKIMSVIPVKFERLIQ